MQRLYVPHATLFAPLLLARLFDGFAVLSPWLWGLTVLWLVGVWVLTGLLVGRQLVRFEQLGVAWRWFWDQVDAPPRILPARVEAQREPVVGCLILGLAIPVAVAISLAASLVHWFFRWTSMYAVPFALTWTAVDLMALTAFLYANGFIGRTNLAARRRYEAVLRAIDGQGLDEPERNAAREKAKQTYLREIEGLLT
ncbi:MAG TPA: hypothetical protein VD866_19030 [Urbifossiella sp.]|nr:hypothetical protein [Urbifossiella sp.]